MDRSCSKFKYVPPGILALSLLLIYLFTLAPGLTWANAGADGGDLITAAAIGGVPHPSGYPLYLLVARAFQWLPFGSLAFRTNLLSAVFSALTAVNVYKIVIRSLDSQRSGRTQFAGLLAGYAIGLAPLTWSQAVITEVYTLNAFFAALILYSSIQAAPASLTERRRLDYLRGLILGLALCNHITILLLAPVALLANAFETGSPGVSLQQTVGKRPGSCRLNWKSLINQALGMLTGLALYAILPLRALSSPAVNWGNPHTLKWLWWLVSGQVYQYYYLANGALSGFLERIQTWASLLVDQFGLVGLILGFAGLVVYFKPSRLYLLTIWEMAAFSVFAIIYQSKDSFVYLIPALISFSIWIGLAVGNLATALDRRPLIWSLRAFFAKQSRFAWPAQRAQLFLIWGLFLGIFIYFAGLCVNHWPRVDASHDLRAETFGMEVLTAAPMNSIVFARGDQAVFSLWYFHYALRERPDIAVIASDFLHYEWYQETIRTVYPLLVLPGPFPWPATVAAANPERPVCYVQYVKEAEISCDLSTSTH